MPEKRLDAELSLKGIIGFGVCLVVVMVAVGALMWWLSLSLRHQAEANDPPLAALPEARLQQPPPDPRLQSDPLGDLRRLRQEEGEILDAPAWVDEAAGVVRIPITAAMDAVAIGGELPTGGRSVRETSPELAEVGQ